jgi:DNA polymerase III delta prime subunit
MGLLGISIKTILKQLIEPIDSSYDLVHFRPTSIKKEKEKRVSKEMSIR